MGNLLDHLGNYMHSLVVYKLRTPSLYYSCSVHGMLPRFRMLYICHCQSSSSAPAGAPERSLWSTAIVEDFLVIQWGPVMCSERNSRITEYIVKYGPADSSTGGAVASLTHSFIPLCAHYFTRPIQLRISSNFLHPSSYYLPSPEPLYQ